jgi:hypothetical protein
MPEAGGWTLGKNDWLRAGLPPLHARRVTQLYWLSIVPWLLLCTLELHRRICGVGANGKESDVRG